MSGLMAVGSKLEGNAMTGLASEASLESERNIAGQKLDSEQLGNTVNTLGSAAGVAAIGLVQAKKSGILNDIF
jgi:hypothetical protein